MACLGEMKSYMGALWSWLSPTYDKLDAALAEIRSVCCNHMHLSVYHDPILILSQIAFYFSCRSWFPFLHYSF